MWSRKMLKNYAKGFLGRHYWKAFLVCLIVTIVSGGSGSGSSNSRRKEENYYNDNIVINEIVEAYDNPIVGYTAKGLGRSHTPQIKKVTFVLIIIFILVLPITVGYALEVGKSRFFLKGFEYDTNIRYLFSTFNSREYFGIVKTMFVRGLYNTLWTLLLIIPGIVKSYEYMMVPYILSEEPNLTANEAITRSRDITYGHKWDIFVLDLSFIGWNLLDLITFGIAKFFVRPYQDATFAKLYNVLSGNDGRDSNLIIE